MPHSKLPDFFSPLLGAVIATATSTKGIIISLSLAFLGGAIGWIGKLLIKTLYFYLKKKYDERKG